MTNYKHDLSGMIIPVIGYTTYSDQGVERKAVITEAEYKGRKVKTVIDQSAFLTSHTLIQ